MEHATPLDSEAACARLGISRRTLTRLVKNRKIGHYRTEGGHLRFSEQDLIDYWTLTRVEPELGESDLAS